MSTQTSPISAAQRQWRKSRNSLVVCLVFRPELTYSGWVDAFSLLWNDKNFSVFSSNQSILFQGVINLWFKTTGLCWWPCNLSYKCSWVSENTWSKLMSVFKRRPEQRGLLMKHMPLHLHSWSCMLLVCDLYYVKGGRNPVSLPFLI